MSDVSVLNINNENYTIKDETARGKDITYAQWQALSETEKQNGDYYITDLSYDPEVAVSSFNGRSGAVTPASGDYSASLITYGSSDVGTTLDGINTSITTANTAITSVLGDLATIESSTTASKAYAVGNYLVLNKQLYKVTQAIAQGGTITVGTNVSATTAGAEIATLNTNVSTLSSEITTISENYQEVQLYHNIPRIVPKDITDYVTDGSIWDRLNGTNGYDFLEDIYVGDYFLMSRAISAYERTQTYQATGSQYVTIAGINSMMGNGDTGITYNHLVMVPGKGFVGTQHFGRSRMNSSNTTAGGYVGSEMFTTTIGNVATSGSTESTATINKQLYAEFGSHLKTTRELLSNAINSSGYNRFGTNSGCASGWAWTSCQAVLMSESEVYGSIAWSSSGYDTGNANHQLPLFANSKQAINNRSAYYWLKDVASSASFCNCDDIGGSGCGGASSAYRYVRPRFILAA